MISGLIGGVLAILFVIALINWRAFARLLGVASAQAGKLATKAEQADPVALIKEALEKEKAKLRQANDSRVKQQGIVNSVERLVDQATKEVADSERRLSVITKNGTDQTRQVQVAKDLIAAKTRLQKAQEDLSTQQGIYANFRQQCELCEDRIKENEQKANRLSQQLDISKATANMAEISNSLTNTQDSFAEVNRHTDEVQRQIDLNNARGKVANERNAGVLAIEAENRQLQDAEALALLEQLKSEQKSKAGMDELFPEAKGHS